MRLPVGNKKAQFKARKWTDSTGVPAQHCQSEQIRHITHWSRQKAIIMSFPSDSAHILEEGERGLIGSGQLPLSLPYSLPYPAQWEERFSKQSNL